MTNQKLTPEQRASEFIKVKLGGISLFGNRGYFQQEITQLIRETEDAARKDVLPQEQQAVCMKGCGHSGEIKGGVCAAPIGFNHAFNQVLVCGCKCLFPQETS